MHDTRILIKAFPTSFLRREERGGGILPDRSVIKSVGTITYFDENVSKDIIETMKGKIERS